MVGGSGEAGRVMLARGHKISGRAGLVGRTASNNQPSIVSDVSQDPNWLPNPLLPNTKSEVAVPISIGDKILGVLDVQQSSVGGLSQGDVVLLQSIANQLAIAVQNTRAYATTQQRAEREALISAINQKIQKATSFDEILKTALEELKQALDLQQGSIEIGLSTMHSDREQS
jgi:GAF domain-containing protein